MQSENPIRSYHFIGICGVAMAQVAAGLKNVGYRVTGSDQGIYPPMSDFLQAQGIDVLSPYSAENLSSADVVVIGNVLSRGNPEVEETLSKRLPYLSLPELIHSEILKDRLPVVVAGTHGKTTTTAALAHLFVHAGLEPGYMIGGLPVGWEKGFDIGAGKWFVIEGDEYDCAFFDKRPKFLHYQPQVVILSNVEFDHADIYSSADEILMQFRRLIRLIPKSGCLVVNADWPVLGDLTKEAFCPVITFGRGTNADIQSELIRTHANGMEFSIRFASGQKLICNSRLWGDHQLSNLTGAAAAAEFAGLNTGKIAEAVADFSGVQRRLELKFSDGKRWLYDDFAHHPTAVTAALSSMKVRHPDLPVFAAFEPRSNTMTRRYFQKEITEALRLADGIALSEVHRADKIPAGERLNVGQIAENLRRAGKRAFHKDDVREIASWIGDKLPDEAVIVVMSSGSFSGLVPLLTSRLKSGTINEIDALPEDLGARS